VKSLCQLTLCEFIADNYLLTLCDEISDELAVSTRDPSEANTHPTRRKIFIIAANMQPSHFSTGTQRTVIGNYCMQLESLSRSQWLSATKKCTTSTDIFQFNHYTPVGISNNSRPIYRDSTVSAFFSFQTSPHELFDEKLFRDSFWYFASKLFLIRLRLISQ